MIGQSPIFIGETKKEKKFFETSTKSEKIHRKFFENSSEILRRFFGNSPGNGQQNPFEVRPTSLKKKKNDFRSNFDQKICLKNLENEKNKPAKWIFRTQSVAIALQSGPGQTFADRRPSWAHVLQTHCFHCTISFASRTVHRKQKTSFPRIQTSQSIARMGALAGWAAPSVIFESVRANVDTGDFRAWRINFWNKKTAFSGEKGIVKHFFLSSIESISNRKTFLSELNLRLVILLKIRVAFAFENFKNRNSCPNNLSLNSGISEFRSNVIRSYLIRGRIHQH